MLAVITNYYNPSGSENKWNNFNTFKSQFKDIDLFIIEAAFGNDQFVLEPKNNVFQVHCKDYIWQQYRLINLISKQLPEKYDKIIWMDADILFQENNWYDLMSNELDHYKIVQSFKIVTFLDRNKEKINTKTSVTWNALKNRVVDYNNFHNCLNMSSNFPTGFSWGVQRDVMERFGIYDYWITGSCDNAFVLGIWGDWGNPFLSSRLNEVMFEHYMKWAEPFYKYINHSVSCLNCNIQHLWHGYRNYKKRWKCLVDFDPEKDITINSNGVLEWTNDNEFMKDCCKNMCLNYDIDFNIFL